MKNYLTLLTILISGCTSMNNSQSSIDNFLWLEDVEGKKPLEWVNNQNSITNKRVESSKQFIELKNDALKILEDKNKIPYITMRGNFVYNFWQDKTHVKGLWRRTTLTSYKSKSPEWEILLDIDLLAKNENENWVFKRTDCLSPNYDQCLIYLSRGGKDASVIREFNLNTKKFLNKGFQLPEAKSWVNWRDKNSLYVGTDFGANSLTTSGYPCIVKIWQRNTPLSEAKTIFTGKTTDMGASGFFLEDASDQLHLIYNFKSFYESQKFVINNSNLVEIPIPNKSRIYYLFKKHLIIELKEDWTVDDKTYQKGSALALKVESVGNKKITKKDIIELIIPGANSSISHISKTKNHIIINLLENVRGKLYSISFSNNKFSKSQLLNIKSDGDVRISSANKDNNLLTYYEEGFLTPRSVNLYDLSTSKSSQLKILTAKFNNKNMVVEQRWSTSKDGTKIPYFIVGIKEVIKKGNAPTELYGYGGFNISKIPYYNDALGKLWLEKGGVYVLANIRGGGEFGPKWHHAALLKNKHKSYEDFISVAEHLIKSGVTTNKKLAISGGSNGGLLVGAVMVKRPDLFNSVICLVPLLDMIRYTKLLAGASWAAEYGDPDKADMRDYILTYSPYQNVKKNIIYPKVLFMTSTKDDRVHPGHARKMAAKMMAQGHKNINYFENTEGGHAASSNLKQKAKMQALIYDFLLNNLK